MGLRCHLRRHPFAPYGDALYYLCVDMREANKAITRGRHLMPTLDEVLHDLYGACIVLKGLVSKNGQSG